MVSLMQRRREMMAKKGEANHLLYSLENYSVTAGERINTGIYPLAADVSCTILLDFTFTAVSSGYGIIPRIISIYNNSTNAAALYIKPQNRYATIYQCTWQGVAANMSNANKGGRNRIAITHEANSDVVNVSFKQNTGTRRNYSYTQTFTAAPSNALVFGGAVNNNESLPEGTITSAKVYDKVLSAEEINSFFA